MQIKEAGKIKKEITIFNIDCDNNIFENDILCFDTLKIMRRTREVYLEGQKVNLTMKEYDILCFLAEAPGQVFSYSQIYEEVWKEPYDYEKSNIMTHIHFLRKKLEPSPNSPKYIENVRGVGYRFKKQ